MLMDLSMRSSSNSRHDFLVKKRVNAVHIMRNATGGSMGAHVCHFLEGCGLVVVLVVELVGGRTGGRTVVELWWSNGGRTCMVVEWWSNLVNSL